jgi:hypothetical protein
VCPITGPLPEISILRGCLLFKIGILGNLPIAHDSLWVLEVMFIEKKFEFEEVLHCTYGV